MLCLSSLDCLLLSELPPGEAWFHKGAASVGPEVGKLSLHHPPATLDPGHRSQEILRH